jgi:hypothetical protein
MIGLDPGNYGTHSVPRTKVALIYKETGNLCACQLLLGQSKLESTVRYLGVDIEDAISLSEGIEIWRFLASFKPVDKYEARTMLHCTMKNSDAHSYS